jgi:polar amino acid transport system substrate-binding protein
MFTIKSMVPANEPQILRVGIDDAPPVPMQMGAPESGDFRGFEVSLLEKLAQHIGCTLQYRRALWSLIVAELSTGKLDLVCSAATVTAERAHQVDFCKPHLELRLAAVVRNGNSVEIDWKAARLGVRSGTTAEVFLTSQAGPREQDLKSESNDELYNALAEGFVDAVVDDSPIALHFAKAVPGLRYAGPFEDTSGEYAVMLRKGDAELRERINTALGSMEADGTLPALRKTWFNTESLLIV